MKTGWLSEIPCVQVEYEEETFKGKVVTCKFTLGGKEKHYSPALIFDTKDEALRALINRVGDAFVREIEKSIAYYTPLKTLDNTAFLQACRTFVEDGIIRMDLHTTA